MVALLRRTLATIPPRSSVEIDWSHPLTLGLKFFPVFKGGMPVCAVNRCAPSAVGAGLKIGPNGGSFAAGTSNNGWFEWSQSWVSQAFASKTEVTVAVIFRATGTNTQGAYLSLGNATNTAYTILGNNNPLGWWPNSGGSSAITAAVAPFQVGRSYLWIGTGNSAACRATIWSDGGLVGDSGSTAALGTLNASLARIRVGDERGTGTGANATGSYSPLGEVHYAAAWNRSFALSEMAQLASAPYAFLQQSRTVTALSARSPFRGWGIQLAA